MNRKVLIVDDNPFAAKLWSRHLVAAGFLVQTALDAISARAIVAEWGPDLVVLDVVLPDADGLALCREWRASPFGHKLRVIVVSALTSGHDITAAHDAGADGYVVKSPETARALPAQVQRLLDAVHTSLPAAREGVLHGA